MKRWVGCLAGLLMCAPLLADPQPSTWSNVERIVAIGDVHGDYGQFSKLLKDAQLIDKRDRWIGGKTHLVQVGDIPDRGPDSRKVIDLMMRLQKQAEKAGGRVHPLIGNHEAMNMSGDLRYVHPGEYAAFADRRSARRQKEFYERTIEWIMAHRPRDQWPDFGTAYRTKWMQDHPLGYVEHRYGWSIKGTYGRWVASNNTVIKINDTLFVHGGLSPAYAQWSLDDINATVRSELETAEAQTEKAFINDDDGPLWYRGLAYADQADAEAQQQVADLLTGRDARRIVIAHTPLTGAVIPRFDARVITVDVGLSAHYGGRLACLIIEKGTVFTLHRGVKVGLPQDNRDVEHYLQQLATLDPEPSPLDAYLKKLYQRAAESAKAAEAAYSDE